MNKKHSDAGPKKEGITYSSPRFLMCAPLHYDVSERINVHMNPGEASGRPDKRAAWKEWMTLLETLITLGAEVEVMQQEPGLEDMVFTANAGLLAYGDRIILANFKHSRRKPESDIFSRYLKDRGYKVEQLENYYDDFIFEGQGDALWWGIDLIASYGFRSSIHAVEVFSKGNELSDTFSMAQTHVIPMKLCDPRWYHGDTACCPISDKLLMWYPDAFTKRAQKTLWGRAYEKGAELIAVTEAEALAFVCNAIPVGDHLVIPKPPEGSTIIERLAIYGITAVPVVMDNFLLSGGAARCLVLNLNMAAARPRSRRA